jgi:GTP cyclohydrolase II
MRNGSHNVGSVLFGAKQQTAVDRGLAEFRAGRPVRIVDADDDIVALPAETLDAERLAAFRALGGSTPPRLIITAKRARALGLDVADATQICLPVEATAETILELVAGEPSEALVAGNPAGQAASAAIDLVKLAHGLPAVLTTATPPPSAFVTEPEMVNVPAAAVSAFRQTVIRSLAIAGEGRVPLASGGNTRFVVFRDITGNNSVAVVIGQPDVTQPVPVRLHSACLTGDVFGSRRCDCGDQLRLALTRIKSSGGGVILYLAQEGRGLGLANKMRAYTLQDTGLDTIDANTTLGFDDDERDYGIAARMLELLGITQVRLLTNNPAKIAGLKQAGIEVAGRMSIEAPVNADNHRYLEAKAARAGHQLDHFMSALSGP